MSTYFDIVPDDILRTILLKVESERDLINLMTIPFIDKLLRSKYFWDLRCKVEFPDLMMDNLHVNFNNIKNMSLFSILRTYMTIKHTYKWAKSEMNRITSNNEHSMRFSDALDMNLLCLHDKDNIEILLKLTEETLKYSRIFIGKDEKGEYYYDIDREFIMRCIEESKVVTLLTNSQINQI